MIAELLIMGSAEMAEVGGSLRWDVGEQNLLGVRASALLEPELGTQLAFTYGGHGEKYRWHLGAGAALFAEPHPRGGTELNVALLAGAQWLATDRISVVAEWRHWSNAHVLRGRHSSENPSDDQIAIGLAFRF